MFIQTALASSHTATCVAQGFLDKINQYVLYPLIIFLSALALLMFLYGAFVFIWKANDPGARDSGKRHMLYGIIGLFVMVSAATILAIAANTFGFSSTGPRCDSTPSGALAPGRYGDGLRG